MVRIEYEYKETFMHRMHPITKLVIIGCISTVSNAWWDLRFVIPLFTLECILCYLSKVPRNWMLYFIPLSAIAWFLNAGVVWATMSEEFFLVLPHEWVRTEILQITPRGTPIVGYMAITYGTLYYLVSSLFKGYASFSIIVTGTTLIYTLNPLDLCQVLIQYKVPMARTLSFMLMAAFRFMGVLTRSLEKIFKSQYLRGWTISKRNPVKAIKAAAPMVFPIGREIVTTVDKVSISTAIRAFGAGQPAPTRIWNLTTIDKIVIITVIPLTAIAYILASIPPYIGMI